MTNLDTQPESNICTIVLTSTIMEKAQHFARLHQRSSRCSQPLQQPQHHNPVAAFHNGSDYTLLLFPTAPRQIWICCIPTSQYLLPPDLVLPAYPPAQTLLHHWCVPAGAVVDVPKHQLVFLVGPSSEVLISYSVSWRESQVPRQMPSVPSMIVLHRCTCRRAKGYNLDYQFVRPILQSTTYIAVVIRVQQAASALLEWYSATSNIDTIASRQCELHCHPIVHSILYVHYNRCNAVHT